MAVLPPTAIPMNEEADLRGEVGRIPRKGRSWLLVLFFSTVLLAVGVSASLLQSQAAPPSPTKSLVADAWQAYRSGEAQKARRLAQKALEATQSEPADRETLSQAGAILQLTQFPSAADAHPASAVAGADSELELRSGSKSVPLVTRKVHPPSPPPAPPPPPPQAPPHRPAPVKAPQLPPVANYPHFEPKAPPVEEAPAVAAVAPLAPLGREAFLGRAQQAASQFEALVQKGALDAIFTGRGRAGEMADMSLENNGKGPMHLHLVPGMVLRAPSGQRVQPLLLDEEIDVDLAPGQVYDHRLKSYCMDSQVPAPARGEEVNYRFRDQGAALAPAAVRVLHTSLAFYFRAPGDVPFGMYREAVKQIAVWKSLQEPADGEAQLRSVLGYFAEDPAIRTAALKDADRLVRESRR